jgi:hypothetical protein
MKYVVKTVYTCPEGAVENVEYWIAESEAELQAMISVQRELSYIGITCLGPVVEPNDFLREKIANATAHVRAVASNAQQIVGNSGGDQ